MKIYHNTVTTSMRMRESMLIYNTNLYELKLHDWKDLLDEIERTGDYLKLFTVGLALFNDNIKEVHIHDDRE